MAGDAPHTTTLSLSYPDADTAQRVARSVSPEVGAIDGDRTTASIDRRGREVTVRVTAADLVALRAGCNTWLTLLSVAEAAGDGTAER